MDIDKPGTSNPNNQNSSYLDTSKSQHPYKYKTKSYDFVPTDLDNQEKLEEKLFEERFDPNNWHWWRQQRLPSNSDDSGIPDRATNLGTP